MKQAILYVFSGTGNTWAVAGYYQKALSSTFQTERVAITVDGGHMPNPQPYDLVALGFPVHAFNAPEIVVRFAKVLPASKKPCFLFTTSGEGVRLNDVSTRLPARILEKKGYRVLSVRHYVMPYNIIFRHSDAMVRQMVLYAKALVPLHASDVLKENKETLRYPLWERVLSFLFRIEWPFCRIEGLMMHADPHTCTLCKACVARCPMHGISVKNKRIHFSSACCICLRCSLDCPQNAISLGLLNGWKVNGPYPLETLAADKALPFPVSPKELFFTKRYFSECDETLLMHGIDPASLPERI